MFDTQFMHLVLRLLLTAFLGGIIGLERSAGDRPAGLRTHVLVATGSALLMIVSIYGIDGHPLNRDPSRIGWFLPLGLPLAAVCLVWGSCLPSCPSLP